MNKKEIISKVLSEDNISSFKESDKLEAMIDNELSKPDPDCELVYELTLNALESKGKKPLCNDANEKLEELKAIQNREKKAFPYAEIVNRSGCCLYNACFYKCYFGFSVEYEYIFSFCRVYSRRCKN